jgi:hypothetical protein
MPTAYPICVAVTSQPAVAVATRMSRAMKPSSGCAQYRLAMAAPAATANRSVSRRLSSVGGDHPGAVTLPR